MNFIFTRFAKMVLMSIIQLESHLFSTAHYHDFENGFFFWEPWAKLIVARILHSS